MADIKATPRNKVGYLVDALRGLNELAAKNKYTDIAAEMLGTPAIERTLNLISYGEPITNIGKANVPLIPGDTGDAAMAVAPMAMSAAKALVKVSPKAQAAALRMMDNAMAPSTLNKQAGAIYLPSGELSSNLDDAKKLAAHIESQGYKPNIIEADGGSVYVTAQKPNYTKSGALSKRQPYIPLMDGSNPYKARFADHPSYWGSTVSSDPFTGNTVEKLIENFASANQNLLPKAKFNPAVVQGTIDEFSKIMAPTLSGKNIVEKTITESRPFSFLGDQYFFGKNK